MKIEAVLLKENKEGGRFKFEAKQLRIVLFKLHSTVKKNT